MSGKKKYVERPTPQKKTKKNLERKPTTSTGRNWKIMKMVWVGMGWRRKGKEEDKARDRKNKRRLRERTLPM